MTAIAGLLIAAAGLHAAVAAQIWARRDLDPSRRMLAVALAGTIPVAGAALAVIAARLGGRGSSPAFCQPAAVPARGRDEYLRLLRDQAPLLHRLSGPREDRLGALAEVARDGGPAAVSALRWVIERGEPDAVVDAALTLEQMLEVHLDEATAWRERGDAIQVEDLARRARRITGAVESGLADAVIAPRVAGLARDLYVEAERRLGTLPARLAASWARLELRAMRPDAALAVLDRCERPAAGDDATALEVERARGDAAFAARREGGAAARGI